MKILNGKVFENGKFVEKEVATDGSFFAADSGDGKEIDAAGCYVIPGLIDTPLTRHRQRYAQAVDDLSNSEPLDVLEAKARKLLSAKSPLGLPWCSWPAMKRGWYQAPPTM